ncbi:MAG: hypothetical protein Q9219_004890 [cf. Caloplaca sp. 3 TL-2023]
MGYNISDANSYLVITGGGISDIKVVKKAWVWPWQKHSRISISPFDFEITLQAMTIEKLQFSLPAVFTTGPDDQICEDLDQQDDIVKGIIEGETRVIVSGMTMEEIFKERQIFKGKVIENVQSDYNANVKELQDTAGSEYFTFLSRKAHEGASNQAKVDVANAMMIAEKRGRTRQELSKIDAQTAVLETKRKSEKAEADNQLKTTQVKLDMELNLARIEADRNADAKDAQLRRDVEVQRAEAELERARATDLVHAKINREAAQQRADADFYAENKNADSHLYQQRQEAEASYFRATKEAEATFIARNKEAEGITEMAKAYGALSSVLGGPQGVLQYMMLQNNTYEKLANANAQAINGLQPKITVWNTGNNACGSSGDDSTAPIRNILQSLPPLLSTINEQTGIAPPSWLAQMSSETGGQQQSQAPVQGKGDALVNGVYKN